MCLLVVMLAELFRPVSLSTRAVAALLAVAAVALGLNLASLGVGFEFIRDRAEYARADLGALELMRGQVRPDFRLLANVAGDGFLFDVSAQPYFRMIDAHGSPAYSQAEIATAGPRVRHAADNVQLAGYGIRLDAGSRQESRKGCRRLVSGSRRGER